MYNPYELSFAPDEVIVYLRKSRSDDPTLTVEEVLSKHEAMLDEWSEKHLGALVPEENKFREVVSGETIADRPKIKEVLRRIESPKIKAILVVEVQRISRGDLEDAGRLMKLLRYTNTMVITPPKTYNLQDEYDRDFFERELKRGNEFLEYQKKIMGRGVLLSVQQGNYVGSVPPYGYDKTFVMDGKRKCPTLKINEEQADFVRMIFDLYVNHNMGPTAIAHQLNALGSIPSKSKQWNANCVINVLQNVTYTGKIKWNWRKSVTTVEEGAIVKSRPKSEVYTLYEGKHDAIISDELFRAAQSRHGKIPKVKSNTKVRNPLAGLVYCHCGRAMALRVYKRGDIERSAPRLICQNQAICHTSSCTFDEMLERVRDVLLKNIENLEVQIQESDNQDSIQLHSRLIKRLEAQIQELEKKEISQWEKYSEEAMPKHIFDSLNAKVLREKEEAQKALQQARLSMPNPTVYQEQLVCFRDALEALDDPQISAESKNKLLKACIKRIVYNRPPSVRVTKDMILDEHSQVNEKGWIAPPFELDITLRF